MDFFARKKIDIPQRRTSQMNPTLGVKVPHRIFFGGFAKKTARPRLGLDAERRVRALGTAVEE
jgi:hypothetical protein